MGFSEDEANELLLELAIEIRNHLMKLRTILGPKIRNFVDIEELNEAFRALHSIKGASKISGFDEVAHLTHLLEDLYEKARASSVQNFSPIYKLTDRYITTLFDSIEAYIDGGSMAFEIEGLRKEILQQKDKGPNDLPIELEVLIAEDDHDLAMQLAESVKEFFHANVSVLHDGALAHELLLKKPFDFAIIDNVMPGIEGLEIVQLLRQSNGANKDMPTIILTGHKLSFQDSTDMYKDIFFLNKPCSFKTIKFNIDCCLKLRSTKAS